MVVVSILGGMGNQLHAYAAAYTVAKYIGQPLVLDVSDYYAGYFHPYVLDLLNTPDHLKLYYPYRKAIFGGPYVAPVNFLSGFQCFINTDMIQNREELLSVVEGKENVWIMGYGGISFCTDEEKNELREIFQPQEKSTFLKRFIHNTRKKESVAVHIRRTDFVDVRAVDDDILKYYQAAISYMEQKVDNPEFYFFSDDIEWAKKYLGTKKIYHYIHCLGGRATDMDEIFCMASCKYHILTNTSTFGAWASILSSQDGMNIINIDMPDIPRRFLMERGMIEEYYKAYKADYIEAEQIIPWESLKDKIKENRNDEVLDYIDQLTSNAYGLTSEIKNDLMELKGIAHIQNNDVEKALSVFDCLQQIQRDSFEFSFNYAVALSCAGHDIESLMYVGNALRINKNLDVRCFPKTEEEWAKEILRLVSVQKKRHYIFLDSAFHRNIKTYYDSIAIMLRNLGNKVTVLKFGGIQIIEEKFCIDNAQVLQKILDTQEKQDSVYDWGIMKYTFFELETKNGQRVFGLIDILPYMTEDEDDVIFMAHSINGIRRANGKYPVIFLDLLSEWDVWKDEINLYGNAEWEDIFGRVDKVITKKVVSEEWKEKKVEPLEHGKQIGADEICFISERIRILNHYMRNDECLFGVLSVLKAAEELENK